MKLGAGIAIALVAALPGVASASEARDLERQLGPGVDVAADAETGPQVTFVGTRPGRAIPLAAAAPGPAAREAASRFAPSFGLRASASLAVDEIGRHAGGRSTVRFQQEIGGLPVIGGELIVNLDERGDLLSIGGELEPAGAVETKPSVGAGEAARTARAAVAKKHGLSPGELRAGRGELSIYDSRILGGPGLGLPRPVWRFQVVDAGEPVTVRELVLIDAELGNVALGFSEIHEAKTRRVCDAEEAEAKLPCLLGDAARLEGEGATGVTDVDAAYDQSGGVYDFYAARFGRDSIDDAGLPLISTARFCEGECPYFNAFWNGEQMTYGPGMITEDIAGHELTHGVTEKESGLFYYYQSGAINESLSDVFGELYDLATGVDPAEDRWLLGEGSAFGAPFRDMANPPAFGDPDRMGSGNWYFEPETTFGFGDAGGVHTNSGVNNKAAYLLTDGDSFNGHEVEGLGEEKALQIYYEVNTNLLGSASDYEDLGNALRQACANLTGEHGIVAGDCEEVDEAVLATEMDEPPSAGAPRAAQTCGSEGEPVTAFFDDFENTGSGNWAVANAIPVGGAGGFFYPQNSHPFSGFDATYASSGETNVWGYDFYEESDSRIAMTADVTVAEGGFWMHFDHAFGFESEDDLGLFGGPYDYDGGVIEYSTDSGASWHDAGALIAAGTAYSGTIFDEFGNPLGGRDGFTGESGGYGSTRLDLAPLAGEDVRFRFRIGTDESVDDYGWFVDDVRLYSCEGAEPEDELPEEEPPEEEGEPEPDESPGEGSSTGDASSLGAPAPDVRDAQVECATQQARVRRTRGALRRSVRRVRKAEVAVRWAAGRKKAKARHRLARARKDLRRKRRAARRARVNLRTCPG